MILLERLKTAVSAIRKVGKMWGGVLALGCPREGGQEYTGVPRPPFTRVLRWARMNRAIASMDEVS